MMVPFDLSGLRDKMCPKCQSNLTDDGWDWHVYYRSGWNIGVFTTGPERLEIGCAKCGYEFWMETADAWPDD